MSEGKRPGGLTALAVINFVFSGFGILGVLGMGTMITLLSVNQSSGSMSKASQDIHKALEAAGLGVNFLIILAAFGALSSILLLISGIGYLKQKKMLGRMLGNLTAILTIIIRVLTIALLPAKTGGGFSLGFLFNIIYPLLTLILLNTTFKDDFTD
jgi:hypothetical protein